MEMFTHTTFAFTVLGVVFGAIFFLVARLLLGRNASPILWAYVVTTLFFVYLLPTQQYSLDTGLEILLLSHLLMIGYLVTILLVARPFWGSVGHLISTVTRVSNTAIVCVIVAWLAWRAYLLAAYGPAALAFSRTQFFNAGGSIEFATWEMALSSITTIFLLGGLVVLVVRLAAGERLRSPLLVAASAMLVLLVVTNESPIGSRRLLFILGALWLSVAWLRSGVSLLAWASRRSKSLILAFVLVFGVSLYYQWIRNNDVTPILYGDSVGEIAIGLLTFATTLESNDEGRDIKLLRSGPFDFFAKIVDVSINEGRSTWGEAVSFSLTKSVPKALYPGEKPEGDVDDVLFDHLAIHPGKPFLNIDYATSLPAIGMADFGSLGVLALALVFGVCFAVVGPALRTLDHIPFATIVILGLAIMLIGSQESGLTAIISSLRDAGMALILVMFAHRLTQIVFLSLRKGP